MKKIKEVKKIKQWMCLIIFAALCAAVFLFLRLFTNESSPSHSVLIDFESIQYTDTDGTVTSLDLSACVEEPPKTEGFYTFTTHLDTISGNDEQLSLYTFNLEDIQLFIDGASAYSSSARQSAFPANDAADAPVTVNSHIQLTLSPKNSGSEIRLLYRFHDTESYIFPPLLRVASSLETDSLHAACTNYYAVPGGMSALLFLLICGVFLFGIFMQTPDYSLIAVAAASACYMVYSLYQTSACLTPSMDVQSSISNVMLLCVPVCLLIYTLLNRKKRLFRFFLFFNLAGALLLLALLPANLADSIEIPMISNLLHIISQPFAYHYVSRSFILLLTNYLILSCAGAAIVFHIITLSGMVTETQMLKEKNNLIISGYSAIINNTRQTSAIRHEWKNDLLSLYSLYQQGKIDELGKHLDDRCQQITASGPMSFSQNFMTDVILQNISQKAVREDIHFKAKVLLPECLPIGEEDLCSLLMNMLNNSVEACCRLKEKDPTQPRFIDFRAELKNGFLAVCCRNSCEESELRTAPDGQFLTVKEDPLSHGFGIRQMNAIAVKYHSLLDIFCRDGIFTAQTALHLPADETQRSE